MDRLPDEIVLKIYEEGGLQLLAGGLSQSCRRFRNLSYEDSLWKQQLHPAFEKRRLTSREIAKIPDLRQWYFDQLTVTQEVLRAVDMLVQEIQDGDDSQAIETWVSYILRNRLKILIAMDILQSKPPSLAHYHWAHWLGEVVIRLEGLHILLDLTCQDGWGNDAVGLPIAQVNALMMLRQGTFPLPITGETIEQIPGLDLRSPVQEQIPCLISWVTHLYTVGALPDLSKYDFFSVLSRVVYFNAIAQELGWNVQLISFPRGTYASIEVADQHHPIFIDFAREGSVRTLDQIQDRLRYTRTAANEVQTGISLYEILATTYVWHTMPTADRHSVVELVEYAAYNAKVTPLRRHPHIYKNIVRKIIDRNVAEVEAPIRRSRANSLVSTAAERRRIHKGDICQIIGGADATIASTFCVVVEIGHDDDSYLVLSGHQLIRVSRTMLSRGFHGKCKTESGLVVPDIDMDLSMLGEYFVQYDPAQQTFY